MDCQNKTSNEDHGHICGFRSQKVIGRGHDLYFEGVRKDGRGPGDEKKCERISTYSCHLSQPVNVDKSYKTIHRISFVQFFIHCNI